MVQMGLRVLICTSLTHAHASYAHAMHEPRTRRASLYSHMQGSSCTALTCSSDVHMHMHMHTHTHTHMHTHMHNVFTLSGGGWGAAVDLGPAAGWGGAARSLVAAAGWGGAPENLGLRGWEAATA